MSGNTNPLIILLGVFILGGILWLNSGGPNRESSQQPFFSLRAPTVGSFQQTGSTDETEEELISKELTPEEIAEQIEKVRKETVAVEKALRKLEEERARSPYYGIITLDQGTSRNSMPDREYLTIRSVARGNGADINITGWRITSLITGRNATIGQASNLPYLGRVNSVDDVELAPGSRAYISTGFSPTGGSMRLNICTGYFEQFQNWNPSLPRSCPKVEGPGYFPYPPNALSDRCLDYMDRIGRCTMPVSLPILLESACSEYISEHYNYNSCVNVHKDKNDFYINEWRLYLDRREELWKAKREVIELRDKEGKLVGSVSY